MVLTDETVGLESGVDDFLVKPLDFDELLSRISWLAYKHSSRSQYQHGDLRLDCVAHRAFRGDATLPLLPREFDLLKTLIQEPNRVFAAQNSPSGCQDEAHTQRQRDRCTYPSPEGKNWKGSILNAAWVWLSTGQGQDDLNPLIAFFQQRYLLLASAEKGLTDTSEAAGIALLLVLN